MTMRISTYADVFTQDHPFYQEYLNGHKRTSGHLLRDVLKETDGQYGVETDLPEKFLVDVRRAAQTSTDETLATVARTGRNWISMEHLRGLDPDTTRIVYGCSLGPDDLPACESSTG